MEYLIPFISCTKESLGSPSWLLCLFMRRSWSVPVLEMYRVGQEEPEQLQFPGEGGSASACMLCPVEILDSFLWPQMNRHRWTQKRKGKPWCEAEWGIPKQLLTLHTVPVERKRKPSLFSILIKCHLRGLSCWLLTLLHIAPFQDECSRLCSLFLIWQFHPLAR